MSQPQILPTTSLAPYVNTFSIFSNPTQGLQQFPQHLSNPPGQTVDWFFNVLSVLVNLTNLLKTASQGTGSAYETYATTTVEILRKVVSTVSDTYSNNERWSSPILPYKGWAANNAVNSGYNPLNVRPIRDSNGTQRVDQISFLLYYWLYFFQKEVTNDTVQINHYTYTFLTSVSVSAVPYGGGPAISQSVPQWITDATTALNAIIPPNSLFTTPAKGSAWDIIQEVYNGVTVSPVDAIQRVPLVYLLSPITTSQGGSAAYYGASATTASLVLLEIFAGTLYNNLSAIAPALNKISSLYDPQTLTYVFDTAATKIADALAKISSYLDSLNATIVVVTDATSTSPLSTDDFAYATTYTTKGSRTSSVDLNRIDGSLVPTITHQLNLFVVLQNLANYIQTNDTNFASYPAGFQTTINNIFTDSLGVTSDFSDAINSFSGQLGIHYSRWSQNLTNI